MSRITFGKFYFGLVNGLRVPENWVLVLSEDDWVMARDANGLMHYVSEDGLFPRCVADEKNQYMEPGTVYMDETRMIPFEQNK
jgi:hypothetical protein